MMFFAKTLFLLPQLSSMPWPLPTAATFCLCNMQRVI